MENKFNLTIEENIFVAKRNIVDYIFESAKLEGLGVTFPETDEIINGMSAPDVKVTDIVAVNNLKHAWQFLTSTTDCPTDYSYICQINRLVGGDNLISRAGYIRNVPVRIGGTSWRPEIPDEEKIKEKLAEISQIPNETERAITLMLYCMRTQMFLDGNKRTAMLAANHEMIINGCGIISIPVKRQREFKKLLVEFYESGDMEEIKSFVYKLCIDGIDFRLQEKIEKEKQAAKEDEDIDESEMQGPSMTL